MKIVTTGQKNGFADVILHTENRNNEPSGIEITIPIQQTDISKFVEEAKRFFKYWNADVRPIFNNIDADELKEAFHSMDVKPFLSADGWEIRPAGSGRGETKAVMGFVPYAIDWEQVRSNISPELNYKIEGLYSFIESNVTTLYFPNGSLSFTPNRESLQYNDVTVKALSQKLVDIYENLLALITSKIANAPNLWEAKINYNRVFRKELGGFSSSETYCGSLSAIEQILMNRIQWNGIVINNGSFEGLDEWDANHGNDGSYHDEAFEPLFQIFVKNEARTNVKILKEGRRSRSFSGNSDCDKILCSPNSIVIVDDLDKKGYAAGLARYYLYKYYKSISRVYVLNFKNNDTRDEFIKAYRFESVPVSYVSQNETLIKAYLKSVRAPRSASGPREARPLNVPYIQILDRRSGTYISSAYWNREDVNARGMEGEGMYYVIYNKDSFNVCGRDIIHDDAEYFWQSVYDLAKVAGVEIKKVYGIYPKTAESVWFKEAVEDRNWINLAEFIEENEESVPKKQIVKTISFIKAQCAWPSFSMAKYLLPLLSNKDGLAATIFTQMAEVQKYMGLDSIAREFRLDGFTANDKEVARVAKLNEEMVALYPFIFRNNEMEKVLNLNSDNDSVTGTMKDLLVNYINMVDDYTS
jgi:hypothetical protein